MAFFGKLIASDRDLSREKPIKLPPIDKAQVMQRFERTLVGRPLLRDVQEHKLKAVVNFLPTVWRCEGGVQGIEMGEGRVHFRFQNEEDLQTVLDNRPYHYDGSMIALERWVPTVRRDFPNTIPFWIVIKGLPDYRREAVSVQSIGEALGEYMAVDVSEPIPRVRVMLNCDSPLIMRRESDDAGQICVLQLQYEKLHKYCSQCSRLTHEAPFCPERVRDQHHHRDLRRAQLQKREVEEKRGNQRNRREDRGKEVVSRRPPHEPTRRSHEAMASSSRPKPVRRALLSELEKSGSNYSEAKPSTKEWVSKAFSETEGGLVTKSPNPRRITQRINKALGVKKKIEHNPFHGIRVHNHMALAILDPPKVLADVSIPSTSKTGPDDGETSKELGNPVVEKKPPADG
ncbi:hypothetical protein AALP_AA5G128800 [Arabis alpina]|uniref:DUF4283 domain-containing protein n=1 Tax=Arabis alpina TaxID=50452 RepID=A0A087GWQ8_ARAAL|nr:hypothetical protein AALP_AA5G128800 [Arabis alpina]